MGKAARLKALRKERRTDVELPSEMELTNAMKAEASRLLATITLAQGRFNDFIAYCRTELGLTDEYLLNLQTGKLVRRQKPEPTTPSPEQPKP